MPDYTVARRNMVECQIRTNKVTDPRVIAAMRDIPRELFVGQAQEGVAYIDEDLPIGNGRFLMEPMVLARLLQNAAIAESDIVLDIGCATGYSTAVIARLASTVVGLDPDPALVASATETLSRLSVDNAVVVEGVLRDGYRAQAPYDVILFGGAVPEVPEAIFEQLAEGGRVLAVICPEGAQGRASLFLKWRGSIGRREIFDASVPPLPGFELTPRFVF